MPGVHDHLAAAVAAADQVLGVRLLVEVDHEEVAAWAGEAGSGLRAVGEAEPVGEGQGPAAVANAYPVRT